MHARDMRVQSCSETLTQKQTKHKNIAEVEQDRKHKSSNLACSKHKGNYKINLGKHKHKTRQRKQENGKERQERKRKQE